MRLDIRHQTSFEYAVAPSYGLLQLRMTPQSSAVQSVFAWDIALEGARAQSRFFDQFGNIVDLIEVLPGADRISIEVSGALETLSETGITGTHNQAMPLWFYTRQSALTAQTETLEQFSAETEIDPNDALAGLHALSQNIRDQVAYTTGETDVTTRAADALARGKGVCQDHAHIFLSVARAQGFPARYVSGYLLMDDRTQQEASHAWTEVFVQGLGWVGFDISNGISPDERYVQLAYGLDYNDAAPTRGVTLGAQRENLIVSIQVQQ
ncbi:MAG: transglutaminase family protein [Pseudomonadota bacterium]